MLHFVFMLHFMCPIQLHFIGWLCFLHKLVFTCIVTMPVPTCVGGTDFQHVEILILVFNFKSCYANINQPITKFLKSL